jgi:hypothetical protein
MKNSARSRDLLTSHIRERNAPRFDAQQDRRDVVLFKEQSSLSSQRHAKAVNP